uniref:Uncharacterized protein LOC108044638 n=1 Tax=Drosophila rhopaloa TaxID=1041015 RepID=A0A6P4ERB5_DRORH
MYKHTVKSKLGQVRSNPPSVAPATPTAPKHGLGAGKKFFSQIRHKIEDNLTPKLSGKLYYKGSKHTRSMSALCTVDGGCVGGKYTPKAVPTSPVPLQSQIPSQMTSSVCSYVDSDEESHLSLSLSLAQQSLEDEIFAELEKVAHDESKLNEVLQSFDHILNEYPPLEGMKLAPPDELPAPPAEFCDRQPLLAKSHSTLSMGRTRMQVYQSPELAGSVLLLRGGGGDSRYNSLSDLSGSRIPVRKQSSLRKRSESFCLEQPISLRTASKQRTRSMLTLNISGPPRAANSAAVTMPKRANSSLEKRQITARPTARRSNSTVKPGAVKPKSPNANSDELLVKCLAKGQEILRQVESMSAKPKRTGSRGVTKEHSQLVRNKKKLQKLHYANEEKVGRPKLESCKIIPPKLGETSDKNQELLVKVVKEVQTTTQQPLKKQTKEIRTEQEEDSDDSGHISNPQLSTSTSTSNSTGSLCESEGDEAEEQLPEAKSGGKSNKIAELLQKFEAAAAAEKQSANATTHCPTVVASKVVAQVQAVCCIQTQVEIYPTYTKEVTMRLH